MKRTRAFAALPAMAVAISVAGCTVTEPESGGMSGPGLERLIQVTSPHAETGMTLLEGPVINSDGGIIVVDVTAPPGEPKVLRIDLATERTSTLYTDDTSAITSAQFSPADGRLYLTDFVGGRVISITADGEDARIFADGPVDGIPMNPDDISFDAEGHLYLTDSLGAQDPYWEASGRLIRLDRDSGDATVLAAELPAPNGLAFTPAGDGLWLSQNTGNRIDYLRLSEDGTTVATAHPAVHVSAGTAQIDSLATDRDGNLYVGLHNRAAVLVYDASGALLADIAVPTNDTGVTSATNIAITPGGTRAFATVSGEDGGYLYEFEALAEGVRSSNGG